MSWRRLLGRRHTETFEVLLSPTESREYRWDPSTGEIMRRRAGILSPEAPAGVGMRWYKPLRVYRNEEGALEMRDVEGPPIKRVYAEDIGPNGYATARLHENAEPTDRTMAVRVMP